MNVRIHQVMEIISPIEQNLLVFLRFFKKNKPPWCVGSRFKWLIENSMYNAISQNVEKQKYKTQSPNEI